MGIYYYYIVTKVLMEYQPLEYNILDETNSESLTPDSKTQSIICVDH